MKTKLWFWGTIGFALVSFGLVCVLLYQPDPVRLHGTYTEKDQSTRLAFCREVGKTDEGHYAIYPNGYPYRDSYLDAGTYIERENGVVEMHSTDGTVRSAAIDAAGRLWLTTTDGGMVFYEKVGEAAQLDDP